MERSSITEFKNCYVNIFISSWMIGNCISLRIWCRCFNIKLTRKYVISEEIGHSTRLAILSEILLSLKNIFLQVFQERLYMYISLFDLILKRTICVDFTVLKYVIFTTKTRSFYTEMFIMR